MNTWAGEIGKILYDEAEHLIRLVPIGVRLEFALGLCMYQPGWRDYSSRHGSQLLAKLVAKVLRMLDEEDGRPILQRLIREILPREVTVSEAMADVLMRAKRLEDYGLNLRDYMQKLYNGKVHFEGGMTYKHWELQMLRNRLDPLANHPMGHGAFGAFQKEERAKHPGKPLWQIRDHWSYVMKKEDRDKYQAEFTRRFNSGRLSSAELLGGMSEDVVAEWQLRATKNASRFWLPFDFAEFPMEWRRWQITAADWGESDGSIVSMAASLCVPWELRAGGVAVAFQGACDMFWFLRERSLVRCNRLSVLAARWLRAPLLATAGLHPFLSKNTECEMLVSSSASKRGRARCAMRELGHDRVGDPELLSTRPSETVNPVLAVRLDAARPLVERVEQELEDGGGGGGPVIVGRAFCALDLPFSASLAPAAGCSSLTASSLALTPRIQSSGGRGFWACPVPVPSGLPVSLAPTIDESSRCVVLYSRRELARRFVRNALGTEKPELLLGDAVHFPLSLKFVRFGPAYAAKWPAGFELWCVRCVEACDSIVEVARVDLRLRMHIDEWVKQPEVWNTIDWTVEPLVNRARGSEPDEWPANALLTAYPPEKVYNVDVGDKPCQQDVQLTGYRPVFRVTTSQLLQAVDGKPHDAVANTAAFASSQSSDTEESETVMVYAGPEDKRGRWDAFWHHLLQFFWNCLDIRRAKKFEDAVPSQAADMQYRASHSKRRARSHFNELASFELHEVSWCLNGLLSEEQLYHLYHWWQVHARSDGASFCAPVLLLAAVEEARGFRINKWLTFLSNRPLYSVVRKYFEAQSIDLRDIGATLDHLHYEKRTNPTKKTKTKATGAQKAAEESRRARPSTNAASKPAPPTAHPSTSTSEASEPAHTVDFGTDRAAKRLLTPADRTAIARAGFSVVDDELAVTASRWAGVFAYMHEGSGKIIVPTRALADVWMALGWMALEKFEAERLAHGKRQRKLQRLIERAEGRRAQVYMHAWSVGRSVLARFARERRCMIRSGERLLLPLAQDQLDADLEGQVSLNGLGPDAWLVIMSQLNVVDVNSCARVCRAAHCAWERPELWLALMVRDHMKECNDLVEKSAAVEDADAPYTRLGDGPRGGGALVERFAALKREDLDKEILCFLNDRRPQYFYGNRNRNPTRVPKNPARALRDNYRRRYADMIRDLLTLRKKKNKKAP